MAGVRRTLYGGGWGCTMGGVLVGQSCRGHSFGGGVYVGDGVSVGFTVGVSLIPPTCSGPSADSVVTLCGVLHLHTVCVCVHRVLS